jgi:hypothetical protein
MNFYVENGEGIPRFIYRNLEKWLAACKSAATRNVLVEEFCEFVAELQLTGDWQKMKWCLPENRADSVFTGAERAQLEQALQLKRRRRNDRLLEVYPHCGDEFSADTAFLDAAFGSQRFELIDRSTSIFTIGSCFANNIAKYLQQQQFQVTAYVQAEDLNSPFSNAKLLAVCAAAPAVRRAYVEYWVGNLHPAATKPELDKSIEHELLRLEQVIAAIQASEFLVITCGNVLDYFMPQQTMEFEVGPPVAPKFLFVSHSEDIGLRGQQTGKLKQAGAEFRVGSYAEVTQALESLYGAIRTINPRAHVLLTLSPIPIDSAIGVHNPRKLGAVEIDCISKSLLRAALYDLMESRRDDPHLSYFPSFEIVRWIAPCMNGAVFGSDDAASRHVSQNILTGVYRYFVHKYVKSAAAEGIA